jgi:integrase
MYMAADALSGFKRLYPSCKRHLDTSNLYYKNWTRSIIRVRALPLSPVLCKGIVSVAICKQKPRLAVAFLLAFLGLLRVSEVLQLRVCNIVFISPVAVHLVLEDTKGAKRSGAPEAVQIRDSQAVYALRKLVNGLSAEDLVFNYSYHEFSKMLVSCAKFFEFESPRLTPHCFRRGGATAHFSQHLSYDLLADHGRWSQISTARSYVDQAFADREQLALSPIGSARLEKSVKLLPDILAAI